MAAPSFTKYRFTSPVTGLSFEKILPNEDEAFKVADSMSDDLMAGVEKWDYRTGDWMEWNPYDGVWSYWPHVEVAA